ncbi:hypothetical protein [Mannheimia varigena]|uniref:Uncharacterized protein n=1 Tax=Mannheimia varigena USDA-ARS-USMARC-1296 TaxID=1433287 RepID=W0Q9C1_9PAST|nr:hypothetical protein [Mannheimia varigena]AHG75136.1 hypothetical protein X808_6130 [Mannheimia varigena USDA-ARS-USMARC-1296]AHG77262.1 hypothetical protein X874_6260 [Mannheimia varigena USDA-ARS-USMARC-1312]TLU75262.1 hypothetical protein FE589_08090 [Mannheimia varigena]
MEWQGIDLSGKRKCEWIFTSYKSIKNITYTLLLTSLISVCLLFYIFNKKNEIEMLTQQSEKLQEDTFDFENKILLLQNENNIILPFIDNKKIEQLFTMIQHIPLKNGGIDTIQFYQENNLYLRMSGVLSIEEDFKKLEQYLHQQDFIETKTEQVNVNHKNETSFTFTIKHKGY